MTSCHMVWASVVAFCSIIIMLATLLSVPFCLAKVPCLNRLVGSLAQLLGMAPPVPYARRKGASGKLLRQLRVTWYPEQKDPEDAEPDSCPICFCEYAPGVAIIRLHCGHFFHKECIRCWLKRDACCPMCKATLTPQQQHCSRASDSTEQPSPATPTSAAAEAQSEAAAASEAASEAAPEPAAAGPAEVEVAAPVRAETVLELGELAAPATATAAAPEGALAAVPSAQSAAQALAMPTAS